MKKHLMLIAVLLFVSVSLSSFKTGDGREEVASLHFSAMVYDFGQVKQGTPVSHDFTFNNPADEAIRITKVAASCGCTVTDYTKEEVAPGKAGFVKATYNAAKTGTFSKTVSVYHSAAATPIVLTIKGEVVE